MSLRTLVLEREERVLAIREMQTDLKITEHKVVELLIKQRHFDMFNVNWRKLSHARRLDNLEDTP